MSMAYTLRKAHTDWIGKILTTIQNSITNTPNTPQIQDEELTVDTSVPWTEISDNVEPVQYKYLELENFKVDPMMDINWVIPRNVVIQHLDPGPSGSKTIHSKYIPSPLFTTGYDIGNPCFWCIQLRPPRNRGMNEIEVMLWLYEFLRPQIMENKRLTVSYRIMVRVCCERSGLGPIIFNQLSGFRTFTPDRPSFGWTSKIKVPNFYPAFLKQIEVTVSMQCFPEFRNLAKDEVVHHGIRYGTIPAIESKLPLDPHRKMWSDFWKTGDWAASGLGPQNVFFTCEGHQFKLHSVVLKAMNSDALNDLVDNSSSTVLDLPHEAQIMNGFFEYCYTGYTTLFEDPESLIKLFVLATDLRVIPLKIHCYHELSHHLTVDNFMFDLAILYQYFMGASIEKLMMGILFNFVKRHREKIIDKFYTQLLKDGKHADAKNNVELLADIIFY